MFKNQKKNETAVREMDLELASSLYVLIAKEMIRKMMDRFFSDLTFKAFVYFIIFMRFRMSMPLTRDTS